MGGEYRGDNVPFPSSRPGVPWFKNSGLQGEKTEANLSTGNSLYRFWSVGGEKRKVGANAVETGFGRLKGTP